MSGGDIEAELEQLLRAARARAEPDLTVVPDAEPVVVPARRWASTRLVYRMVLVALLVCAVVDTAVLVLGGRDVLPTFVALVWLEPPLVLGIVLLADRLVRSRR